MFRATARARKISSITVCRLPSALDNRPLRFDEFEILMKRTVFVSATPAVLSMRTSRRWWSGWIARPTGLVDPQIECHPASTQVDDLLSEINGA